MVRNLIFLVISPLGFMDVCVLLIELGPGHYQCDFNSIPPEIVKNMKIMFTLCIIGVLPAPC